MSDDVLCVKYSPDNKLIAVALLDSTVKVFHEESLKFFLSLYGHKLPVMSLSISSDSTLIATASADKNVKVCYYIISLTSIIDLGLRFW
jgi:U3 small nucleolar RNA-associated protein 12